MKKIMKKLINTVAAYGGCGGCGKCGKGGNQAAGMEAASAKNQSMANSQCK